MKTVTITQVEYDDLHRKSEELAKLKAEDSDLLCQVQESLQDLREGRVTVLV